MTSSTGRPPRTARPAIAFALAGLLGAIGYHLVPSERLQDLAWVGFYAAGTLAVVVGIRVHRPQRSAPWWCVGGLLLLVAGSYGTGAVVDTLWHLTPVLIGGAALHPSMTQVARASQPATSTVRSRRLTHMAAALERTGDELTAREQQSRDAAAAAAATVARTDAALLMGRMVVWDWNPATGAIHRSDHARRLFGLPSSSADPNCTELLALVHPGDRARLQALTCEAVDTTGSFETEYRLITPTGEVRHVRDVGRRIPGPDGQPILHGVMIDITAQREVEQALCDREAAGRAVLDSLPAATAVLDGEGIIRAVNGVWLTATCDEDDAVWDLGDNYLDRWQRRTGLQPQVRDAAIAAIRDVLDRRVGEHVHDYEILTTGTWYQLRVTPLRDGSGGAVVAHLDVTEHKLIEAQLRQAQKMEAVGQLAGGVAHDFNNLLTAISGYTELARAKLTRLDVAGGLSDLDEIERATVRAATLISQLLTFSRRQPAAHAHVDLHAVIADVEGLLERLIGSHIRIKMSLGADRSGVRTDAGQLEQVIVNLAVNARDAMAAGGRLDLRTRTKTVDERGGRELGIAPGDYVELVVADTGTGMPPEVVANAFEPFFTTKPEGSGTGLGLAMVYGCVTASAGHVRVESVEGRGTAVSVLLPRCDAEPVPSAPAAPSAPRHTDVAARAGETILLVEDQPMVRRLLMTSLEGLGYRVLGAEDGVDALSVAQGQSGGFDLLLTDVVMPNMNGPELVERLRARGLAPRVLFMSGYTRDVAVPIGDPQGPGFLQKPFSLQELGSAVREVLARSDSVAS